MMRRRHSTDALPVEGRGEVLMGIAGSHGVVVARAVVVSTSRTGYARKRLKPGQGASEWKRFVDAVCEVQTDLRALVVGIEEGRPEASILEAYLLMVGDEMLARRVHDQIHQESRCADWAVAAATDAIGAQLGGVDDPYMRERRHDVEFVGERLLRALGGVSEPGMALAGEEPMIVVARDLSPADTAQMLSAPVVGFVTEVGSRTSHTSIMARALAIPAVVGVRDATQRIATGDLLVLDGLRGRVIIEPGEEQLEDAERRAARVHAMAVQLGASRDVPAVTKDGVRVALHANIELPDEAVVAVEHGAEGVGLYRTEFLYVNRKQPPSEEEQLDVFRRVITAMAPRPVTLRTFDIGGDKFVSSFQLPDELNPMLGLRAVRLALSEPEVFLTQLRAMVRASAFGEVRIMIPMVSTIDELTQVRALLERAKAQVVANGDPVTEQIALGVMIEVPAAAIMARAFAAEADFMSIGTNDLVQYTLAVDRTNRALALLASPYDPAILRLVDGVIRAGAEKACPVSLCGEMASDLYGALLLVGLGLRDLSMESVAIPEIKEALRRVELCDLEALAAHALELSTNMQVETLLEDALEKRMHDLLTSTPDSAPSSLRSPVSSQSSRARRSRPSEPDE